MPGPSIIRSRDGVVGWRDFDATLGYPLIADSMSNAQSILLAARASLRYLILGAVIGGVVAAGAYLEVPPDYSARVTILVTPSSTPTTGIDFNALQAAQALAPTLSELTTTTPVLSRVIASTNPGLDPVALAQLVTTRVPTNTSLIEISVSDKDASMAAALANAFASELVNYQARSVNVPASALQVTMTVVDPATPPLIRNGPGIVVTTALGAGIGVFLELGVLYLLDSLRRSGPDMRIPN